MGIITNIANAVFSGVNLILSFGIEIIQWIRNKVGKSIEKEIFTVKEEREYSRYFWLTIIIFIIPFLVAIFFPQQSLFFLIVYYSVSIPLSLGIMVLSQEWPQVLTPDIKKLWKNLLEVSLIIILDFITLASLTVLIWIRFMKEEMTVYILAPYILTLSTVLTGLLGLIVFLKSKENRDYLQLYDNVDSFLSKKSKDVNELKDDIKVLENIALQAHKDGEKQILSQCAKQLTILYERLFTQLEKKVKKSEIRKLRAQKTVFLSDLQQNTGELHNY